MNIEGDIHSITKRYFALTIWLISCAIVLSVVETSIMQFILFALLFVIFSVWGHVLIYPLYYKKKKWFEGFVWGCVLGIPFSALIISIIVYFTGWRLFTIFGIVVLFPTSLLLYLIRKRDKINRSKKLTGSQYLILMFSLTIVTGFFFYPFKNYGALVDGKYIYAWLFGHDFNNRLVFLTGLSQQLPLESYHFSGEMLSYYWLSYIYPAMMLNMDWLGLGTETLLQLTVLYYALLISAALFIFLNAYAKNEKELFVLILLAFCGYSFADLYIIFIKLFQLLSGQGVIEVMGYDLTRFSGVSHTFYRFFLVQPHATLGIGLILMMLTLYKAKNTSYHYFLTGLCAGLLFGVDATNGIMMGLWLIGGTLYYLIILRREAVLLMMKSAYLVVTAFSIYVILFFIEMYSLKTGQGVLEIKPNGFALMMSGVFFSIEYGPAFLLGLLGFIRMCKEKQSQSHDLYLYSILLTICFGFTFFISNPIEVHFGLLKSTRIVPICLLVFSAYYLHEVLGHQKKKIIVYIMLIIAFPTLFTDNYIASDIHNPTSTYVNMQDKAAAQWIKSHLPENAIIQAEPQYPGNDVYYKPAYYYSFIPVFAERRTIIGEWKVSSIEHAEKAQVGERFRLIKEMFSTTDVNECMDIIKKYHIDYVYSGEREKKIYRDGFKKFIDHPNVFERVYSSDHTDIFRFIPTTQNYKMRIS